MKKTVILALVAALILTPVKPAQAAEPDRTAVLLSPEEIAALFAPPIDHWETREQCQAAKDAPWYEPSIISNKPLGKDEIMLPHPTGVCYDIDLPDRLTKDYKSKGHGWVRIPAQRNVIYGKITGTDGKQRLVPKRLAQCDNTIFAEAPLEEGGVIGNPLEYQQNTGVAALLPGTPASLGAQAREMAKREAASMEKRNDGTGGSGKVGSAAKTAVKVGIGAVAIAAAVYAAKKILDSLGSTVTVENNNSVCVTTAGTQCKP